jgi:3-hydroxyisobutyrate dehydrogenase-like beta-hydroxyacid dehydrogenase
MTKISFIGLGEAAGLISAGLIGEGTTVLAAFDVLIDDDQKRAELEARAARIGMAAATTPAAAVTGADIVISAVTCDQTVVAAQRTASSLSTDQIYLDINSASPKTKRAAAEYVEDAGAAYVEAAVMDLVPPHGHKVPMLLAGTRAEETAARLRPLGMDATAIGMDIGQASAVKMVRSVFMKGFSAILLESLYAASKLGAEKAVLDSLMTTYPQFDWHNFADHSVTRLAQHARRQSHEMAEVAETLHELGVEPITALATASRLGWLADVGVDPELRGYREILSSID